MFGARIDVYGSLNLDNILYVEDRFGVEEATRVVKREVCHGGHGANVAKAIVENGHESVSLISMVGQDDAGVALLQSLTKTRINTERVAVDPILPTGRVDIIAYADKRNLLLFSNEISRSENFIEHVRSSWKDGADMSVIFDLPTDLMLWLIDRLDLSRAVLCLNSFSARIISLLPPSKWPKYVIANIAEFNVSGISSVPKDSQVIVTCGSQGVRVLNSEGEAFFEAPSIPEIVDTIGAGDAFSGAFVAAMQQGQAIEYAVKSAINYCSRTLSIHGARQ
ncbi:carbohydrate kinase family protein [Paludibacterium purpuratum]|uniref:Sugar/nucleoside kinase (Ribokinase family) n=1 Tax=Paludibacterium purpuratum TaxID=1144873 RepID=A0A4R7B5W5_9NEIS|nr:carbohydrate kinase family protein [Paludibacterium purpuratum]TDR80070.1 sugar/nucleoside kinase (ribokinase family) [Paludibacterium purpuratum]